MARRSTPRTVYASTKIGIALAAVEFTVKISFSIFLREIFFTRLTKITRVLFHFVSFCFRGPPSKEGMNFLFDGTNVFRGNLSSMNFAITNDLSILKEIYKLLFSHERKGLYLGVISRYLIKI